MKKKKQHTIKWLAVLWAIVGVGSFLVILSSIFLKFDFRSKAITGEKTVYSRWEFNDKNLDGWSKVGGSFVYYDGGLMFTMTNNLNGPPASALKYSSPIILPEGTKEITFRLAVNPLEKVVGGPENDSSANTSDRVSRKCFSLPKICNNTNTQSRARFCRLMEEVFPVCKSRPTPITTSRALEMRISYLNEKLFDKPVMVTANSEFKEYKVEIPGVTAATISDLTMQLPVADSYRELKLDWIRIQGTRVTNEKKCTPMPEECRWGKCKYILDPSETWCPEPTISGCGPCPAYAEPAGDWCPNGRIVIGDRDKCGCYPPPRCATCTPRPACLDANPPCDIPESENMCPPKVIEITKFPIQTKYSCNTSSDCVATCGLGCVNSNWLSRENPNDCSAIPEYSCTCSANKTCVKVEPTRPPVSVSQCVAAGCSGQLCVDAKDADINTDCMWKEEYACYRSAECVRKDSGTCGWKMTDKLEICLREARAKTQ